LFWSALIVAVTATVGISRIELGDDWIKYFDESFEFRRATDFVEDNLSGVYYIEYSLSVGEAGGINSPSFLKQLEAFADWYRAQPEVVHVNTITDTMKRLNKNMHMDDNVYYRLPQQRDLAAQYLLLYEMSLPLGLDLNNQINIDKSATRMIVSAKGMHTSKLRQLDARAQTWLRANAPDMLHTQGTGLAMIWAHLSARNINNMLWASFGALVLISGILIFALRSVRLGFVSLVPNVAPAFMAFGVWGLLVGQVGLGLSIVVSLTLGIVVDDTVHFLSHYLRAQREQNLDVVGAIRYSFNTVGAAMWISTATLVAGFLVLSFSGYKMNADMGLLSAITITLALAMDFFFLPPLLLKIETRTGDGRKPIPDHRSPALL
jgi:predicted RND superfamily exporter protein